MSAAISGAVLERPPGCRCAHPGYESTKLLRQRPPGSNVRLHLTSSRLSWSQVIGAGVIMTLVRDAEQSPPRWGKIALIVVAVISAIPIFSPIIFRTFLFQPFYIPAGSMMP